MSSSSDGFDPAPAWFETAFGELYPILYAHRDDQSARTEADFAVERLRLQASDLVLDLGCGGGRHQRRIIEHGIRCVGMDLSRSLLAENRQRSSGVIGLVRGDMRVLPFATASFDVVLSFFTSFGYFPTTDEDRGVLEGIARVVRPGGKYLLDYLHAPSVVANLVPRTEREVAGYLMIENRRVEDGCVKKTVEIRKIEGGDEVAYEESVRLYEPDTLEEMIEAAGFEVGARFGSLDGKALGDGSRCVLLAERRS